MENVERIALRNLGIKPADINAYREAGGYIAMEKALQTDPSKLLEEIVKSGLRGRGGAGFPTGIKQGFTRKSCNECPDRYVVCNADEGEPGTFKDRVIMENDPLLLVEGMTIAAWIVGASKGFIYIRGEYYKSINLLKRSLKEARKAGYLGDNILGSGFSFDIEIRPGAGSYLCGEELTLLESLEGKRGYPRIKPPFPAEKGLWGKPTLVNNVETLCHLPAITQYGSDWYRKQGTAESPGTKIFTLSGNVKKPGFYELPMGITLRELITVHGGGTKDGKPFHAALLGGAAGTYTDASNLDLPMAYETLKAKELTLGSGAVIVLPSDYSIRESLCSVLEFFKHESCGKCIPCRVGCKQLLLIAGKLTNDLKAMDELLKESEYMAATSLCPLGQSPIMPIRSAIRYFSKEITS